jgi:methyltransferase
MILAYAIILFVVLERLAELPYAARNTKRLLAQGAVESGRAHYPLFILLHASWLVTIVALLPKEPRISWLALAAYVAVEGLRAWTILTLGPYWTTRIIALPNAPLVKTGPYRFVSHPNYCVVILEIALLPLVFGEVWVAMIFSALNAMLLTWRIRLEEKTLAPRRALNLPGAGLGKGNAA